MSSPAPTRTLPARAPDGWIFRYSHYRNYILFAATSVFMAIACVVLLFGIRALAGGNRPGTTTWPRSVRRRCCC